MVSGVFEGRLYGKPKAKRTDMKTAFSNYELNVSNGLPVLMSRNRNRANKHHYNDYP